MSLVKTPGEWIFNL